MSKIYVWLHTALVIAAICSTFLLLTVVGYRLSLGAADGFRPYLNHVSSFDDIFLCMKVGLVSFLLLGVVEWKNHKSHKVGRIGLVVFILAIVTFFLMRKFNLISTYEEFAAHGV